MKRILMAACALLAAAWLLLWLRPAGDGASSPDTSSPTISAAAIPVAVQPVELRRIADRTEALGTLRARESVEITAPVTETITRLFFDDGDWVEAGAVLALLAQAEEQAQLAQEQATLAEQKRELARLENLARRNLAATTDVDQRRTLLAQSEQRLREITARIDDRTLRAPFAGQLGLRQVSLGALVTPGTEITTLDDTRRMRLDFSVPASLVGSVVVGQSVIATSQVFAQPFEGTVSSINSRVNPTSRSFIVRAEFDNPDGLLKPGLLMKVELLRAPREALVAPEESLLARQDKQFLLVVNPDTLEVVERPVVVGSREPGWAEIRSGVVAGEWVITEGVGVARPGATVQVKQLPAQRARPPQPPQAPQPPEPAPSSQPTPAAG